MTDVVVVVGRRSVTGVHDSELTDVALDCVDDRLAVYANRIVAVRDLWCLIAASALGERCGVVTLVVPSWWPASRAEVVEDALLTRCADVVVRRRGEVLRAVAPAVVECGDRGFVVHGPDGVPVGASDADEVLAALSGVGRVWVDGSSTELERRLERRGVEVIRADDDDVRAAVAVVVEAPRVRSRWPRVGAVAAAVGVTVVLAAAAVPAEDPAPVTWVAEGRVTVEVPADWTVERLVAGPGSARVQVVSPDGVAALHVTQAVVPQQETLAATARALQDALRREPAGVFSDFNAADVVADRAAVTYRETRTGVVGWTVIVDDGVRIAVGCRDGSDAPRRHSACEHAIRTARAIGGINSPTGGTEHRRGAS